MAIGTYAQLQAAVQNWLARADLAVFVPDFIALCEAKLNRELRCAQMETRSYTAADTSDSEPEYISLPSDFQTMRSVRLSGLAGKPMLEFLTQQQADDFRYKRANAPSRPQYFTIIGTEMELLPTPDQDYEIEMVYRRTIPALSDSNTTNWLLTVAPDVYLYGSLMEAEPYLENDKRVELWGIGYGNAVTALNKLSMDQTYNAGPITIRATGYNP